MENEFYGYNNFYRNPDVLPYEVKDLLNWIPLTHKYVFRTTSNPNYWLRELIEYYNQNTIPQIELKSEEGNIYQLYGFYLPEHYNITNLREGLIGAIMMYKKRLLILRSPCAEDQMVETLESITNLEFKVRDEIPIKDRLLILFNFI